MRVRINSIILVSFLVKTVPKISAIALCVKAPVGKDQADSQEDLRR